MEGIRISNKEYRQREGISSSELKKLMKSPMHYKYWKDNPEEADSPALLLGRVAHKYVLETYDFYNEFAVAPNCDRRTKEGKAEWLLFCDQNEGKDIITQEQFEQIEEMRKVMLATPFVSKLINGEHEISYFWVDEDTGLECKCRPDSINHKLKIVVDYKTTEDAETETFMRSAIRLGYDVQASYYLDGVWANLECSCCGKKASGYYEYNGNLYCEKCFENYLNEIVLQLYSDVFKKIKKRVEKDKYNETLCELIELEKSKAKHFTSYIFVFIAQEKKPPYAVNILQASDVFIESGRQTYKSLLETYKECEESGNWFGYMGANGEINSLGVPKWIENMLGTESEGK